MKTTNIYDIENQEGKIVGTVEADSQTQAQTRLEFTFGDDSGFTAVNGRKSISIIRRTDEEAMQQIVGLIEKMENTSSCAFNTIGRIESICKTQLGIQHIR